MRATATFTVSAWTPVDLPTVVGDVAVPDTAAPTGLAAMVKTFTGDLAGRAVTWFVGGLNEATGAGSYAAVESFDGTLGGRSGTFGFLHAASTHGTDRYDEHFVIIPGSGTGDLVGIAGTGSLVVDDDGTHHVALDYTLP